MDFRTAPQQTSYFGEKSLNAWSSPEYFVAAFEEGGVMRLDIHRQDLADGIGWDDLQRIKNACGYANCDAIEFYPAERDVLNCQNIRHLYVFPEGARLPLIRRKNDA